MARRCVGSLVQHRNPIYDTAYPLMSLNCIESALMGKIQDQSVSTYVLDSLSALTLATSIQRVTPYSNDCKLSYQISWPMLVLFIGT
jgi:hypothetical protein